MVITGPCLGYIIRLNKAIQRWSATFIGGHKEKTYRHHQGQANYVWSCVAQNTLTSMLSILGLRRYPARRHFTAEEQFGRKVEDDGGFDTICLA